MADFCEVCAPEYYDFNVQEIADNLEDGALYSPLLCEGCGISAVFKEDNKVGYSYGFRENYRETFIREGSACI